MNAFEMFAAQHERMMAPRITPAPRPSGARPDTPSEKAALDHITANPGVDVRQVAAAIKVDAETLYTILQRLRRNGQIESTGRVGNSNRWRAKG